MYQGEEQAKENALLMIIFGGTGDLTHRKLLPALYHLMSEKSLSQETSII